MDHHQNEQLQLAAEFVQCTNKNIFLTGKAGTGKTTFLHNLKKITPKRLVVVAPTGVAAINAGGVTIHSFFQLGFGPLVPGQGNSGDHGPRAEGFQRKFNREKINLIKCIDLLVIDEISMVRSDILDAVDEVLRKYRNHSKPFGGVQLLMIGDLHQLSPVIKEAEWKILKEHYQSVYFFDSKALRRTNPVTIELKEVFRQSDAQFIALLNKVRDNEINDQVIKELNSRFIPGFNPSDDEGYITLTTHNANALELNQAKLRNIPVDSHFFPAEIEGDFPAYDFPTEDQLELKPSAQVMFIKNDPSPEKRYYNGKIGKITRIEKDAVFVKCPSDPDEIAVEKVTWENVKYTLDNDTKEIKENIAGSFTQIPLKLAWAITIHKSQGLTFEKVIIDANAAFAFGQVYVALSRCKTFNGIVLSTPISSSGIKTDSQVMNYSHEAREKEPGPVELFESKLHFQQELIFELFDLQSIKYRFESLLKLVKEHLAILDNDLIIAITENREHCEAVLFQIAGKFKLQLAGLMKESVLPEERSDLQDRIKQGASYFMSTMSSALSGFLERTKFDTDNMTAGKLLNDSLEKLQKAVFVKVYCLEKCQNGFETISYIKSRSNAEVDFRPPVNQRSQRTSAQLKNLTHPELYSELRQWRDNLAGTNNIPLYMVMPRRALLELANRLPLSLHELKSIKGIGPSRVNRFGEEIVAIIRKYCFEYDVIPDQTEIQSGKKRKK